RELLGETPTRCRRPTRASDMRSLPALILCQTTGLIASEDSRQAAGVTLGRQGARPLEQDDRRHRTAAVPEAGGGWISGALSPFGLSPLCTRVCSSDGSGAAHSFRRGDGLVDRRGGRTVGARG